MQTESGLTIYTSIELVVSREFLLGGWGDTDIEWAHYDELCGTTHGCECLVTYKH